MPISGESASSPGARWTGGGNDTCELLHTLKKFFCRRLGEFGTQTAEFLAALPKAAAVRPKRHRQKLYDCHMTADLDEARPFLIDGAVGASHIMIATRSSIDEFAHTAWRDDAVGPDKRTLKEACYLLLNCSLFGGLRPDERAEVVALARVRTFNAGETVFAIGSPGDQMMALLSG